MSEPTYNQPPQPASSDEEWEDQADPPLTFWEELRGTFTAKQQRIVYMNETLETRPRVKHTVLDRFVCNFYPNPKAPQNYFVSMPFHDQIENFIPIRWDFLEELPDNTEINPINTIRAILELREMARYFRTPKSKFLDYYIKTEVPKSVTSLNPEEFNRVATKWRCQHAMVVIPNLDARTQAELYRMNFHPRDACIRKWRRFYNIMDWPQPRHFNGIYMKRLNLTNTVHDRIPVSEFANLKPNPKQERMNKFVSIPHHSNRNTYIWRNVEIPREEGAKEVNYRNTIILVHELREYARFHLRSPGAFLDDFYNIDLQECDQKRVSTKKLSLLHMKWTATAAGAIIPEINFQDQLKLFHLNIYFNCRNEESWKKFFRIMQWDDEPNIDDLITDESPEVFFNFTNE